MASEIRVDKINSLSGVGTVTLSPTGVDIAGITTAATLRATTGIVTSLTAGSLTSLGAVSGTTGTFTGDVDIADTIVHTGDTNTKIRFPAADTVSIETGGSEALRVDSSKRLLIGHTSSQQSTSMLQVSRTNNSTIRVANSDATVTNYAALDLAPANSIAGARIAAVAEGTFSSTGAETAYLKFDTRNAGTTSEKVRITAGGDLRLGLNSVANVTDSAHHIMTLTGKSGQTGAGAIAFRDPSANTDAFIFADDGVLFMTADYSSATADSSIRFRVDGSSEKVRILSSGGITFNGDTAAANALDDYEEGEYTPAVSNGQTLNTSYDRLRYTKIGRQVSITGQLVFSTYNSSDFSTTLTIGLPFLNGNGGDRSEYIYHAGIAYFNPSSSSSPSNGYIPIGFWAAANSSHVSVFAIDPNTDTTIGNWVGSGSDVWVNLTYFTDA